MNRRVLGGRERWRLVVALTERRDWLVRVRWRMDGLGWDPSCLTYTSIVNAIHHVEQAADSLLSADPEFARLADLVRVQRQPPEPGSGPRLA